MTVLSSISISAAILDDCTTFVFQDGPLRFVKFLVTDPHGNIMWELHPSKMHSPASLPVPESNGHAGLVSFRAEPPSIEQFQDLLTAAVPSDLLSEFPSVTEITYGVVPDGYSDDRPAMPLESGVDYRALVMTLFTAGRVIFRRGSS